MIIMKVTDIKTSEKGCSSFRGFKELVLHLNDSVEVLEP